MGVTKGVEPHGKHLTGYLYPTLAVAAGTTADTNIAVAGITTADEIVRVIEIDIAGNAIADRTAEARITSNGNVQLDTTNTTASWLLIFWADVT